MSGAILVNEVAERLERVRSLNAVLAWSRDALEAESARVASSGGALAGKAIGVKDNIVTTVLPTTCASRILEGYQSPFDATVIERIRAAGGLVACKTNLDEFAMGSSTEHSAFGRTMNPIDPAR